MYRSNAIYSFIPKVACSSLRFSLAICNGCIADEAAFQWIHSNNETFRATLEDLARASYSFVVLRDPFSRLASCYLDKIVGKGPAAWQSTGQDAETTINPTKRSGVRNRSDASR